MNDDFVLSLDRGSNPFLSVFDEREISIFLLIYRKPEPIGPYL